ncbi:MAG: bifunctional nuclease family protein [Candidatus Omnitrophica bacterium]|nr:bifunctional nuclease family protein [Candidatus Omnitrophota bacterium]
MIEFEISKIIIDEKSQEQVIVLKEKEGSKLLPIVIGINEAAAIRMKFGGFTTPRPLTHDLLKSVIDNLEARLEKVVIDKLVDSTFHAKLFLKTEKGALKSVDARPSDSIALAVRTQTPIFVEEEVINRSSFPGM